MPRTESRTKTSIWSDDDFRKLTRPAQGMYWMLYSQPTINLCGVLALTERRWAQAAAGETIDTVRAALRELVEHGYIVVDYDTEEVWVRTFIRHDGVGRTLTARVVAWGQLASITSPRIRRGAADVLREFGPAPESWIPPEGMEDYALDLQKHPEESLFDRVWPTPPPTLPPTVGEDVGGRSRGRTRAVSVSSLLSPTPVSSLRDPPPPTPPQAAGENRDRAHSAQTKPETPPPRADRQLDLAHAVVDVCHGANRSLVRYEAAALLDWALPKVDPTIVEEAIGWASQQAKPPDLPRALAGVIASKAADRRILLEPFQAPGPRRLE